MRIAWSIVFLAFLMPIAAFPQAVRCGSSKVAIVDGTGNPWYLADIGCRSSHWLESWKGTSTHTLTADSIIDVLRDCSRITGYPEGILP